MGFEIDIRFPLVFSNKRLGTAWYPKRAGRISIYVANHSHMCNGNIERIMDELTITTLEEITHLFSRCTDPHDYYDTLEGLL